MSQHITPVVHNGKNAEVLVGWDAPLQRFFLVVEDMDFKYTDDDEEDSEIIYSNLLDKNLPTFSINYQDLGYFKRILENLKIQIPEEIWQKVLEDRKLDR